MDTITLKRTGMRSLEFTGEPIGFASSQRAGDKTPRRHEIAIYRTTRGEIVVRVSYRTTWRGELDHDHAKVFPTPSAAASFLEDYEFPNASSIGYPPLPSYDAKQKRLMANLSQSFNHTVTDLLSRLPEFTAKI